MVTLQARACERRELDPQRGLNANAVRHAQARHGPNALPVAPPKPLWRTFARQFKSPVIYILLVAAVLAVALGHNGDAMVILAVLLINALIGSFQEGRAERSMAALRRLAARARAARRRRARGRVLNCQSARVSALGTRIVRNRWLLGGLSMLLQALVLYAPPMNALFHTVPLPLPLASLLPLLGLAGMVLSAEEARKLWVRTMHRARP